jgi:hypothetical protein
VQRSAIAGGMQHEREKAIRKNSKNGETAKMQRASSIDDFNTF